MTNSYPTATVMTLSNKKLRLRLLGVMHCSIKICTDHDFWVKADSPIPLDINADSPSLPKLNSGVGYSSRAEYLQDVPEFISWYIEFQLASSKSNSVTDFRHFLK